MKLKNILLALIIIFTLFSRFYKLGEIPAGIYPDEESHAYNAYSIIQTGKDRYGKVAPILFRSFGSYQPPVLTYLTIIPVAVLGNTIFAARTVNATFSVFLVLTTYFLTLRLAKGKNSYGLALIAALLVAISPWSLLFSRLVAEGYLGLTFFILSVFLFVLSLDNKRYFPLACLILGLSTHAYYSERIISLIFLPAFLWLYRRTYQRMDKKWFWGGIIVFLLTLIPHLIIAPTGALTRRFVQVGLGSIGAVLINFVSKYISYFSPRNLFFDTGAPLGRVTPEMGVYFSLLIIPFFWGIKTFKENISSKYFKLLILLIIITPVSAALTGDSFYPLRALDFIWLIGLIIAIGVYDLYLRLPKKNGFIILLLSLTSCLFSLYISYFVLFKYEKANEYPGLIENLNRYKDRQVIIDSTRDYGIGLRLAYLMRYSPKDLQKQLASQMATPYYSGLVGNDEVYKIGNIEARQFSWQDACRKNTIIVGDILTLSESQAKEHNLKLEFEIKGLSGDVLQRAYSTNPTVKEECGI